MESAAPPREGSAPGASRSAARQAPPGWRTHCYGGACEGAHFRKSESHLFGTDGIRGVANEPPMTPEMALRLGRAVAYVARQRQDAHAAHRHRQGHAPLGLHVRDRARLRASARWAAESCCAAPCRRRPWRTSPVSMRADAGVVISASHNPVRRTTGSRSSGRDGFKLPDEVEAEIERLMESDELDRHAVDRRGHRRAVQARRRARPLRRLLQEHLPRDALARRRARGRRRRATAPPTASRPLVFAELGAHRHGDRRQARTARNINKDARRAPPGASARARSCKRGAAHRHRARRRRRSGHPRSTRTARSSTATSSWRSAPLRMLRRGRLPKTHRGATVMSNLGLERAIRRRSAASSCARRSAIATSSRRCGTGGYKLRRRAVRAPHLPRPRHHRRRHRRRAPGARASCCEAGQARSPSSPGTR